MTMRVYHNMLVESIRSDKPVCFQVPARLERQIVRYKKEKEFNPYGPSINKISPEVMEEYKEFMAFPNKRIN